MAHYGTFGNQKKGFHAMSQRHVRPLLLLLAAAASALLLLLLLLHGPGIPSSLLLRRRGATTQTTMALDEDCSDDDADVPVIGVFAQPLLYHEDDRKRQPEDMKEEELYYVAASYEKWLAAGGARSIVVPYDATNETYLDELFYQVDGLLLPGGATTMSFSYRYLLDRAIRSNLAPHAPPPAKESSSFFPVWGTCLGFEFLVSHVGMGVGSSCDGGPDCNTVLEGGYDAENVSLPLYNVSRSSRSRGCCNRRGGLYDDDVAYRTVTTRNVTMNNHEMGLPPSKFLANENLTSVWRITSTNVDKKGKPFVSTIEPVHPDSFPVYGVQYHPEKNAFEYGLQPGTALPHEAIDHSPAGIAFSHYEARYFVDLARIGKRRRRRQRQSVARHRGERGGGPAAAAAARDHRYDDPERFPMLFTYPVRSPRYGGFEQIYVIPSMATAAASSSL